MLSTGDGYRGRGVQLRAAPPHRRPGPSESLHDEPWLSGSRSERLILRRLMGLFRRPRGCLSRLSFILTCPHRLLELLHRLPERPGKLGKSFGSEKQQQQHEPDEQILIANHCGDPRLLTITRWKRAGARPTGTPAQDAYTTSLRRSSSRSQADTRLRTRSDRWRPTPGRTPAWGHR